MGTADNSMGNREVMRALIVQIGSRKLLILIMLMLIASLTEGVGLLLLVPITLLIIGQVDGGPNGWLASLADWPPEVPLAVLAMLCSVLVAWYWLNRWLVVRNYQSGRYLHIAQAAAAGMIALICLRMISWHQSDLLLYGWRLNWIIDPALSLIVGWSALRYRAVTKISNHPV